MLCHNLFSLFRGLRGIKNYVHKFYQDEREKNSMNLSMKNIRQGLFFLLEKPSVKFLTSMTLAYAVLQLSTCYSSNRIEQTRVCDQKCTDFKYRYNRLSLECFKGPSCCWTILSSLFPPPQSPLPQVHESLLLLLPRPDNPSSSGRTRHDAKSRRPRPQSQGWS